MMGESRTNRRPALWGNTGWLALLMSALISLPYLLSCDSFFSSDDWVHLGYNAAVPPWAIWRYFSPRVIWFYRPLQALQFGWLYHAVGLHPLAYNLSLWVMHLGVCALVYRLAARIVGRSTAVLTTALFAAQWAYLDVPLWPSNFSTLHWALATLGVCSLFLEYLESRRPILLVGLYALLVLDFMTKESAVSTPLLLGALWWWRQWPRADLRSRAQPVDADPDPRRAPAMVTRGEDWRALILDGVRLLGPIALMTGVYLWVHGHVVRDVWESYGKVYYRMVSPAQAVRQTLFAFNHVLLSFHRDPVLLPLAPALQRSVRWVVEHGLVLPLLLCGLAYWRRDRNLGLGILWVLGSMVPVVWLVGAHTSRFYYLPAFGSALIVAHGAQQCWQTAARSRLAAGTARARFTPAVVRWGVIAGLLYLLIVNVSLITLGSLENRDDAAQILTTYRFLRSRKDQVPHGSLIVVRHLPDSCFVNGTGLPEMVRIALGDGTAQAVLDRQVLPHEGIDQLHQIRSVYLLDFAQRPLTLRRVRRPGQSARRIAAAAVPGRLAPGR